tara:strand:- start:1912 stop:2034 length:123 start_codon:yes stop_codon:yes gene_type:complete
MKIATGLGSSGQSKIFVWALFDFYLKEKELFYLDCFILYY